MTGTRSLLTKRLCNVEFQALDSKVVVAFVTNKVGRLCVPCNRYARVDLSSRVGRPAPA
jgi:hypothetical protein